MFKRRASALAATAAATIVTLAVGGAPARADDVGTMSWEQCTSSDSLCFWQHINGGGANFFTGRTLNSLEGFNNQASSFWNRTNSFWCVYERVDHGGGAYRISPQERRNFSSFWNDNVESVKYIGIGEC
jgi:hypothetical protein